MAKKKEKLFSPKKSKIGFDDIVGHKQIKKRLQAIIKILKNPKSVEAFDITPPKGLLLYGPESIGKSMLARAFAKEAGLPYLEISGSKLFDMQHIKKVYESAIKSAPCVVILEDVDIKGYFQGTIANVSFSDIAKEIEELPCSPVKYVFTIATAISLEEVDQVLTAPEKLDFLIEVSKLDKDARRFFIEKVLKKPNDGKINIERIVRYITGMSAQELERLGRMASLSVVEQEKKFITEKILIEQINIIKYGHKIENQMVKNPEVELKMTAYHEAAHAVLSTLLLPDIKIEQVTIAPRSKMLGFVSYNVDEQISNVTKEEIFNDICVLLAGRVAKIKKSGKESMMDSGAVTDLSTAAFQAYSAITNLGMDKELGFINIDAIAAMDNYFLSQQIEKRFLHWMDEAKKRTVKLVDKHWDKIEKLALALIEKEIIESDELEHIIGKHKISTKIPESI
ncbi:MAG: AAA family ATPase [Campylobacterota bacterium]|nr:AAA family ATPase [Campylobacterota bacterium]